MYIYCNMRNNTVWCGISSVTSSVHRFVFAVNVHHNSRHSNIQFQRISWGICMYCKMKYTLSFLLDNKWVSVLASYILMSLGMSAGLVIRSRGCSIYRRKRIIWAASLIPLYWIPLLCCVYTIKTGNCCTLENCWRHSLWGCQQFTAAKYTWNTICWHTYKWRIYGTHITHTN
jgi:hypothetical protein